MRKVAEGLPRGGGEKRIGGARETWGIVRKRENKPRGRGKKSRRRKNEVKNEQSVDQQGKKKK